MVGAGAVVTKDVPDLALGLAILLNLNTGYQRTGKNWIFQKIQSLPIAAETSTS